MAKRIYIGTGGKANKVKKIYVGVLTPQSESVAGLGTEPDTDGTFHECYLDADDTPTVDTSGTGYRLAAGLCAVLRVNERDTACRHGAALWRSLRAKAPTALPHGV